MPLYQNTSVDSTKLIIGNYKIETAPSATGTFVNLGAGMVSKFGHNPSFYTSQAGNAPDPVDGIADENFTVDMELIEYDASVLSAISGGILSSTVSTTQSVLTGGGNATITNRAFRLTNRRLVSGVTKTTVILLFNARMNAGLQFTPKSDNDADPVGVMPISIIAEPDSSRTVGSQLFSITKDL